MRQTIQEFQLRDLFVPPKESGQGSWNRIQEFTTAFRTFGMCNEPVNDALCME